MKSKRNTESISVKIELNLQLWKPEISFLECCASVGKTCIASWRNMVEMMPTLTLNWKPLCSEETILIYWYLTSHIFFLHLKFKVLKESAFGFTPIKFTCAPSFVTGLILPSSQQKIQITWISPSWYMDLLIDVFHQINLAKLSSENPNLSDIMNLKCIVYFSSDLRFVKKFKRPDFRTKNFAH